MGSAVCFLFRALVAIARSRKPRVEQVDRLFATLLLPMAKSNSGVELGRFVSAATVSTLSPCRITEARAAVPAILDSGVSPSWRLCG